MLPTPQFLGCSPSNFMSGRDGAAPSWVVIHTMDGTWEAASARFDNPTQQVSAHYGITYQGDGIKQWVRETDTAYQAGVWAVNLTSIGIEHEDMGLPDAPRPAGLYETSAELVRQICGRWGIPIQHGSVSGNVAGIIAHRETGAATSCPDALDVARIIALAAHPEVPAPPPPSIMRRSSQMFVSQYNGLEHLFYIDATGQLQHDQQPPGGYSDGQGSWRSEAPQGASGLVPGGNLNGDQFGGAQHLYAPLAQGGVLHAFQSLTGQPSWAWGVEKLP